MARRDARAPNPMSRRASTRAHRQCSPECRDRTNRSISRCWSTPIKQSSRAPSLRNWKAPIFKIFSLLFSSTCDVAVLRERSRIEAGTARAIWSSSRRSKASHLTTHHSYGDTEMNPHHQRPVDQHRTRLRSHERRARRRRQQRRAIDPASARRHGPRGQRLVLRRRSHQHRRRPSTQTSALPTAPREFNGDTFGALPGLVPAPAW